MCGASAHSGSVVAEGEEDTFLGSLLTIRAVLFRLSSNPRNHKVTQMGVFYLSGKNYAVRETEVTDSVEIFIEPGLASYFPSSLSLSACAPVWIRQPRLLFCTVRVLRKAELCPELPNAVTNHLRGNDTSVRCALSFTMRWQGRVSTTTAAVFSVSTALPSRSPCVCSCLFFFWRNKRKQHLPQHI